MRDRTKSYKYISVDGLLASTLLEYLMQGGTNEKDIGELARPDLDLIHEREDCADFKVAYLVRVLYLFEDKLPSALRGKIIRELISFPYRDCGGHGMCTWTENHRLYVAGSEYLMAQKYGNAIFEDGRDSEYHLAHAREFLKKWMEHSLKYGLCEWESNNYYSETMAGLSNVIQFIKDEEIVAPAKKVLTMMFFDMFSQTCFNEGYMFNPACARAYADNKVSSKYGNYEAVVVRAVMGEEVKQFKDKEGCVISLLQAKDESGKPVFEIPERLKELLVQNEKETAFVQGVDIADYPKEGLQKYSPESVQYAFEAGAFSDYRVINNTMRYVKESGLIENKMLSSLKALDKPILTKTGLLKLIKRFITVSFDGVAMEEGRVYTYCNRNFSISSAWDYRVGEPSYQQNSQAINLSNEISLFACSPSSSMSKSGSPGYWIGSGTTPRSASYKNIAASIFDVAHAKLGRKETHLFFPTGLFDMVDLSRLSEGILFGHTKGVNVYVRTNPGVEFLPANVSLSADKAMYQDEKLPAGYYDSEYDLVNNAKGYHFYLYEADNTKTFEEFKAYILNKEVGFNAKTSLLNYDKGHFVLSYKGAFTMDGQEIKPRFERPVKLMEEFLS